MIIDRERLSEIQMGRDRLTAMVWEEVGVIVSRCIDLEVASCGDTPKQGLAMLRAAIQLHLENALVCGRLDEFGGPLLTQERYTTAIEVETT